MDFQCTIGIIILAIAKAKRRTTKSTGTKNYESLGILSAAKIDKCFVCKNPSVLGILNKIEYYQKYDGSIH